MSESNLNQPHFQDADKAREYLERVRWVNGINCPHCGVIGAHYKLEGKSTRPGVYKCADCREQFTVTVGTVFERSKIKLNVWLAAVHLICASKKGMSSKQIERMLGVTYKTAWFMTHRIREAMKSPGGIIGGGSNIVEADETYVGGKEKNKHRSKRDKAHIGGVGKQMIFSLVERGGQVRSMHLPSVSADNLRPILNQVLSRDWGMRHAPFRRITFQNSKSTDLLQLNDLLIGTIGFRVNRHHLRPDASQHKLELARHVREEAVKLESPKSILGTSATRFTVWPFKYK